VTVSERSQINAPGTDQELPGDVMDLEENDLEAADIPDIASSSQGASRSAETGPACTAVEYIVYAPSYQVPAFYFTDVRLQSVILLFRSVVG
jgi:hypothetical protein